MTATSRLQFSKWNSTPIHGSRSSNYPATTCGIWTSFNRRITKPSLTFSKNGLASEPGFHYAKIQSLPHMGPLLHVPGLGYGLHYLVSTIPTVGSGGNSRRDIQTPPSWYVSQPDAPAKHFCHAWPHEASRTELFAMKPGYTSVVTLKPKLRIQWLRLILKARDTYGIHCHPGHVPVPIKGLDLTQLAKPYPIAKANRCSGCSPTNCVFKISQIW